MASFSVLGVLSNTLLPFGVTLQHLLRISFSKKQGIVYHVFVGPLILVMLEQTSRQLMTVV